MDKTWATVVFAIVALFVWKNKQVSSFMVNTQDALQDRNVQAFLALIRQFESGGDYGVLYGGKRFTDFSSHPNVHVPFNNPLRAPHPDGSPNDFSTAAGAYQINHPTWLMLQALFSPADFSPANQDLAAVYLLKVDGSLSDVIAGHFADAINAASNTWASLPSSTSGQRKISMQVAQSTYNLYGGQIA